MRSQRILVLLCAAPLVLTWMGCSNRALRVSRATPAAGAQSASHTARMMQLAERYEEQGNREGALRLYRQVAAAEPGNSQAQARITAITGQAPRTADVQRGTAVVSAAPEASPSAVDARVASARTARAPTQPAPTTAAPSTGARTTELVAASPREMPVAADPAVFEVPPASDPTVVATWTGTVRAETPAAQSAPADSATQESSTWWEEVARPQPDPAAGAGDPTSVVERNAVDAGPEWTRTSLVRLCPDAEGDLRAVVARLDADDNDARKEALMALSDLRGDAAPAAPAVDVLLGDADGLVRAHAAWAAWRIGDTQRQSVTTLADLTQSETDDVVQVAAFFLGSIGPDARSAVDALRSARPGSSGVTRLHLAEALIRIDPYDLSSLNELTRALQDPDARLRWLAAVALSGVSEEQASWVVPALTARLGDVDPSVSSAAALTLGSLGPAARSAVGPLEQAATHQVPDVRLAAEAALACIQR